MAETLSRLTEAIGVDVGVGVGVGVGVDIRRCQVGFTNGVIPAQFFFNGRTHLSGYEKALGFG